MKAHFLSKEYTQIYVNVATCLLVSGNGIALEQFVIPCSIDHLWHHCS